MDFFDRKNEIALLRGIRETARTKARMTILKGRRRVGKTSLLQKAYGDGDFLYFFVARKNEAEERRRIRDTLSTEARKNFSQGGYFHANTYLLHFDGTKRTCFRTHATSLTVFIFKIAS